MLNAKMSFQIRALLAPLALLIVLMGASHASTDNTYRIISSEELKTMLDARDEFTLIDARTKDEFDEAHIVRAINIPEKNFEGMMSTLPANRNALLIIYCNGMKCGKSKKVASKQRDTQTSCSMLRGSLYGKKRQCLSLRDLITAKKSRRQR